MVLYSKNSDFYDFSFIKRHYLTYLQIAKLFHQKMTFYLIFGYVNFYVKIFNFTGSLQKIFLCDVSYEF